MKKTWENPNLANLALGETKTVQSKAIIDGTCTNCGQENIGESDKWGHAFNPETGSYDCDQVQPQS